MSYFNYCYTCGGQPYNKDPFPFLCKDCYQRLQKEKKPPKNGFDQFQGKKEAIFNLIEEEITKGFSTCEHAESVLNAKKGKNVLNDLSSSQSPNSSIGIFSKSSPNAFKKENAKSPVIPNNQNSFFQSNDSILATDTSNIKTPSKPSESTENDQKTNPQKRPISRIKPKIRPISNKKPNNNDQSANSSKLNQNPSPSQLNEKPSPSKQEISGIPCSFAGKVRCLTREERGQKPFVCSYCGGNIDSNWINPIVFLQCSHEQYHDRCFAKAMAEGKYDCSTCHLKFFKKM